MTTPLFLILPDGREASKVKHYEGLPPELTNGEDARTQFGSAAFLVIEAMKDGVFLFRYDRSGECVGDTWHM